MLVIKVELWPYGEEAGKTQIAEAKVWNEGRSNLGSEGHTYSGTFHTEPFKGTVYVDTKASIIRQDRNKPVWSLLKRMLDTAGY